MACQCVSLGYGAEESATAVRSGLLEAVTLGTRLVATTDLRALTPAAPLIEGALPPNALA